MIKSKIEAVLFLTDKPMKAAVIARTLNEDVQVVRQGLLELIHDYEERKSGLEVADDNGYIIQVKDEYSSLINEFAPLEMPLALLRTLSAIAIKQPVQQSEIIKIRGAGAYDHIRDLMIRELVIKKEADEGQGRSPLLSTTKKFQEYFRLSGDGKSLRTELRKKDVREERSTTSEAESQLVVPLNFAVDVPAEESGSTTGEIKFELGLEVATSISDAAAEETQSTYSESTSIDNLVAKTLSEVHFTEQSNEAVETLESSQVQESVEVAPSVVTLETSQVDELLSLASDANQVDELLKAAEEISQANDVAAEASEQENETDTGINVVDAVSESTGKKSHKVEATASTDSSEDASATVRSEIEAANNSEAVEALQELFDSSPDNSPIFREENNKKENKSARARQARNVESNRPQERTSDLDGGTENSSNSSTDAASEE